MLAEDLLRSRLRTRWLGRVYEQRGVVGSTNDEVARLAAAGAPHGLVLLADRQRSGRGRLGRVWHGEPGESLTFSALLRPQIDPSFAPLLSLAAAVGLAEAVSPLLPQPPVLKWPNDLLVGGRKLSGILLEMSCEAGRIRHAVLGVGLNVNGYRFPLELAGRATSLRLERGAGEPLELVEVLAATFAALERWLDRLFAGDREAVLAGWRERAGWLGQQVTVHLAQGPIRGVAADIDADGALLLRLPDGRLERVLAGDLVLPP